MGGETAIVLVTQAADFVFDGRHVKATSDAMVGQGLSALKKINALIVSRTRNLSACSIAPQPFMLQYYN
jgi:hypothetical protein